MQVVNPEAIGLFGLIVTVWCFGLEQVGIGIKDGDHKELGKSLAYIALFFGGITQIFTALAMYLFNVANNPAMSIYLGTVFATYGIFWVVIAVFFLKGGDKKMIAHFFGALFLISLSFLYKALEIGNTNLAIVLALICGLFIVLIPAWYGKSTIYGKIAGMFNILIGIATVPLFLHALGI